MTRYFLTLYLSIVIVLAGVSWGQERLRQSYGGIQPSELPSGAGSLSAVTSYASRPRLTVFDAYRGFHHDGCV